MASPPLPDVPCVRVRCIGNKGTTNEWGVRFYFRYSGSAPSGANCATLAGNVATAWTAHLISLYNPSQEMEEVDVLDIATNTGLSGQASATATGTEASGVNLPILCATNCEFGVAIRYRGGKPRMYLPPPTSGVQVNEANYTTTFTNLVSTNVAAFFAAINGTTVGSMSGLQHVLLSYYEGYVPRTTGGGQTTFKPKYRSPNALHYDVTGYFGKGQISSQKRRRVSTTP